MTILDIKSHWFLDDDHTLFTHYRADILDGEFEDDTVVGEISFIHVNGELLFIHDDPLTALDDYDEQTHRCQPFITKHGTFKANIINALNSLGRGLLEEDDAPIQDFILIDKLRIEPKHRNKGCGTMALNIIKAKFPSTPIILQPFPIDSKPTYIDNDPNNIKTQLKKIKKWYVKRGFVRIQRSEMYVAYTMPWMQETKEELYK
jgi:hypothetical protein